MTFRNKLFPALLGALAIFTIASSSLGGRASALSEVEASFCLVDSLAFEEGNILLRRGNSIVSSMIVRAFPEGRGMSHCGVLVRNGGNWELIHSISGQISDEDGIRSEPLQSFVKNAKDNEVLHVKPAFGVNRQRITHESRVLLASKLPFDHGFDLDTPDKLYCTELVRRVYLAAGAPDVFIYKRIGDRQLIDMASFFGGDYWRVSELQIPDLP